MKLTDSSGNSITLGGRLGAGGEAKIFSLAGRSDHVAKIYHQPSAERVAKLQVMISAPPVNPTSGQGHRSICWPISLLFNQQGNIVGFLMPRLDSATNLPIFKLYNPQDRQNVAPGFTWQYLMRAAANVASVVSAIHSRGYVIGDLNESNILVNDRALVSLVDCDSMQVPQSDSGMFFRCPVGKPEFTPPELQGYDFGRTDRAQDHDNFGLGVLIFLLLMEGTHPFSGIWHGTGDPPPMEERIRRRVSPYTGARGTKPMPGAPPFEILSNNLQGLFQRCFREGHQTPGTRPTPKEWQSSLTAAENNLIPCNKNQLHFYSAHLVNCPWCERTKLLGGFDPFPISPQQQPLKQSQFVPPAPVLQARGAAALPPVATARILTPIPKSRSLRGVAAITVIALIVIITFLVVKQQDQHANPDPVNKSETTSRLSETQIPSQNGSLSPASDDTRRYDNPRFGYVVSYPSYLLPQGQSANGDGQEFVSADGSARLTVWGSDNTMNMTLDDELKLTIDTAGFDVTYKHRGKDFYAVSGFLGDKILYERVAFRQNVFWGFRLIYDQSRRVVYDALPSAITKSYIIPDVPFNPDTERERLAKYVPEVELPSYIRPEHQILLANWLIQNPRFRLAVTTDCHCEKEMPEMRRMWDNQQPYYVSGDFNRDGQIDFAVILIDKSKNTNDAVKVGRQPSDRNSDSAFVLRLQWDTALLMFNGPLTTTVHAALFLEGTGSPTGSLLFFKESESKLLIGPWASEGSSIIPSGNGYTLRY